MYEKITEGAVIQKFNDAGECISQEFVSSAEAEYDFDGLPINITQMPLGGNEYFPFDMKQP